MTDTEDLLRRSLHDKADRTAYEPSSVLAVARRARELRRRRRITTVVAAAAAAVAVGVPTAVVMSLDEPGRTPEPAGPASDHTVTIGSLSGLPTGAPPAVDHVLDQTYVFAAGGRTELDVEPGSVLDAAPYAGGLLVTTRTPSGSSIGIADHLWFDRGGELEDSGCGGEELALSGDGRLAAYVYLAGGCDGWERLPTLAWHSTTAAAAALAEAETVNGQRVEPVGVSVTRALYNVVSPTVDGSPMRVYTIAEAGVPVEVKGISRASAWDPATGRVAGCSEDGPCAVVDEQDGSVLLALDTGEEPLSFSPDGRLLATMTSRGDGSATVTVRDSRTGDRVVTLVGEDDAYHGDSSTVAWEDDGHLLLARVDADGEALVRLGVDGSAELATPVAGPSIGGYLLPGA